MRSAHSYTNLWVVQVGNKVVVAISKAGLDLSPQLEGNGKTVIVPVPKYVTYTTPRHYPFHPVITYLQLVLSCSLGVRGSVGGGGVFVYLLRNLLIWPG